MNTRYVAAILVVTLAPAVLADRQLDAAKEKYIREIEKSHAYAEKAQTDLIAAYGAAIKRAESLLRMRRKTEPTLDQLSEELTVFRDQLISLPSLVAKSESMIPLSVPILLKLKSGTNRYLGLRGADLVVVETMSPGANRALHFRAEPANANGEEVLLELVERRDWLVAVSGTTDKDGGRAIGIANRNQVKPVYTVFVPRKPLKGNKGASVQWSYNGLWITHNEGDARLAKNPDPREASFEIIPVKP